METAHQYKDDDFVYVDPDAKTVVGLVEWTKDGMPKKKAYPAAEETPAHGDQDKKGKGKGRSIRRPRMKKRYYPWGTYRSMKKVFRLEKKVREPEPEQSLDDVLPKALNEVFWD